MTTKMKATVFVMAIALAGLVGAEPDIQVTRISKVDLGGRAMTFLASLGAGSTDMSETIYLKGNMMRTDVNTGSTIVDLDGERIVTLDNKKKVYSVVTFEELMETVEVVTEDAGEIASTDAPAEEPDMDVKFDFKVDRTGTMDRINGFNAERVLMTITFEATSRNTARDDSDTEGGTLVILSELWMSQDVRGYDEIESFQRRYAEKLAGSEGMASLKDMGMQLQQAFASDPRISEGMEKVKDEGAKIQGVDVRNTTYIVSVVTGAKFDPDPLFASKQKTEEKSKKGRLGRLAKMVAQAAVGDEDAPMDQQVVLTVTSEMSEFKTSPLSTSLFEIPGDYRNEADGL